MNYTVTWQPFALNRLAELWMAAADRNAVAEASDRIDAVLADNPLTAGEGRDGNERILFDRPLAVGFRVDQGNRTVAVFTVSRAGRG